MADRGMAACGIILVVATVLFGLYAIYHEATHRTEYSLFGDEPGTEAVILISEDGKTCWIGRGGAIGNIDKEFLQRLIERMEQTELDYLERSND